MKRNRQTQFLGGLITIIILIILIVLSNVDTTEKSFFDSLGNKLINPIQVTFTRVINKIKKNQSYYTDLEDLRSKNIKLEEENRELSEQVRELEILRSENKQLQEFMNMNLTEKYATYDTIPAYVISKDISNYSNNIVVNVGKRDGVEKNMVVIADQGLVGHVISVTETSSKIQVIVDSASTVSSKISTTEESILCKGTLDNDDIVRATYIPINADLIPGDIVVTSGIGIYPEGIYIGSIKEIVTTSNITDRYAIVAPGVDFSTLSNVLIIKGIK